MTLMQQQLASPAAENLKLSVEGVEMSSGGQMPPDGRNEKQPF